MEGVERSRQQQRRLGRIGDHSAVHLNVERRCFAGQESSERLILDFCLDNNFLAGQKRHTESFGNAKRLRQRIEQYQIDNLFFALPISRSLTSVREYVVVRTPR